MRIHSAEWPRPELSPLVPLPLQSVTTIATAPLVDLENFRRAARTIFGVAVRTPLLRFEPAGPDVWLKPEMLQRGGAFKFRGAYTFLSRLSPEARARGVVAPS